MGKKIYGVDLSEKITPMMVRDAIIICFRDAHREVLDELNRKRSSDSEAEIEGLKKVQIDLIVRSAFEDVKADFSNPTKEDIVKVLGELAKFASRFRKPEIIKRHYNEIMRLVEKCGHQDIHE
ncbi:MAG: hypothetical protein V1813_03810 [Candidatus Aenigmatarchaeota archaeon]